MAVLVAQSITLSGIEPGFAAVAAGGDEFLNDGRTYVGIANGSIFNSYTVRFAPQATVDGIAFEEPAVTLSPGAIRRIGPFPTRVFNDDGAMVHITYSGSSPAAALTIGVFSVG